jgi:hypothetical protein
VIIDLPIQTAPCFFLGIGEAGEKPQGVKHKSINGNRI